MGECKMRYSRQRESIYDYLKSTQEHPSAEMIYEYLKSKMSNLSLGTVYRNLKVLEELGKARKVATFKNAERYDACFENHAHFVCECCGSVKDLLVVGQEQVGKVCGVNQNDKIQWMNIVFGGICKNCSGETVEQK